MAQLPLNEAIARFEANESKVDVFVNQNGLYTTNEPTPRTVETLPSFMARKDSEVNARYLSYLSRGNWLTATAYNKNDLAVNGGIVYLALTDHTSGTFNTDYNSNKWAIYQDKIDALFSGAAGNGTTNDTSAFTFLETNFLNRYIDLVGKTYLVDKIPVGNYYYGGFFKTSSDNHIYKAGRFNPSLDNRGAEVTLKQTWNDSRYAVPAGLNRAIVVLGDSISHGAFAGNIYQDGWVNILKRMLNAETGGVGYGFAPLLTLGSGGTLSKEVHDVSFSGTWAALESTTGGENVLQGLSYTSSTAGNSITITVPTFQKEIRIWYIAKPGGGSFKKTLNGVDIGDTSTSSATTDTYQSLTVPMNDNGAGSCSLVLSVVSGSVTLCGVGYETSPGGGLAGNVVQNFSQSGRRLKPASEDMIDLACRGSVLILALGYNDSGDVMTDAAYNTAFQQRIDWIIKYCIKYNTTLVVADFCWFSDSNNLSRQGLKRAAIATRGIYVPFPDYLTRDQTLKTEYTDSYYMVDTLTKWTDTAHPNKNGNKWIAETMAKAMGLSCTSKVQALAFHDYAWPLQFDAASLFKNQFAQMPYISYVRRNGNSLVFSLKITTKVGGAFPAGSNYVLNKPTNATNSRQFVALNSSAVDYYMPVNTNNTGLVSTGMTVSLENQIKLASFNPYLNSMAYGFSLPYDPMLFPA